MKRRDMSLSAWLIAATVSLIGCGGDGSTSSGGAAGSFRDAGVGGSSGAPGSVAEPELVEPAGEVPPMVTPCGTFGSGPLSLVDAGGPRLVVLGSRNLVYSLPALKLERELVLDGTQFAALDVSADGKWAAAASEDSSTIALIDLSDGSVRALKSHVDDVVVLRFAPDGTELVSGSVDKTAKIWTVATGTVRATLTDGTQGISRLAVSDASIATNGGASLDRQVLVYDRKSAKLLGGIESGGRSTTALAFYEGSKGESLARGTSGDLSLWLVKDLSLIGRSLVRNGVEQFLSAGANGFVVQDSGFSSTSISSLVPNDSFGVFDYIEKVETQLPYHATALTSSIAGTVTLAEDNIVRVQKGATEAARIELPDLKTWSADVAKDGKLVIGGKDGKVRVLDPETGMVVKEIGAHAKEVIGVAVSPNGDSFATTSLDGTVRLFSSRDYGELAFNDVKSTVAFAAFSPAGDRLAVGVVGATDNSPGSVIVFKAPELTRETQMLLSEPGETAFPRAAWGVAFAPDGSSLAAGGSAYLDALHVWNVPGYATKFRTRDDGGMFVVGVLYTPDSRLVIAGASSVGEDAGKLIVRTADAGKPVAAAGRLPSGVKSLALVRGAATLVSGEADGSIAVWQLGSFAVKQTIAAHAGAVLAIRPAGPDRFMTAGADGIARLWCFAGAPGSTL